MPPVDAAPDTTPVTCPTKLVGYATLDGGTTGGGDATIFVVSTLNQLRTYAGMAGPAVVRINGVIEFDASVSQVEIASDKTILPNNLGDGLIGNGFIIKDNHNVILRDLTVKKALAPYDAITVQAAHNVWIDHCDLSSDMVMPKGTYDGLVDITHGSYNVTVSWTWFHDHFDTSLVGHTDTVNTEDSALAVTFHHNLFQRVSAGSPRARFGHVHLFSNHYDTVDMYGIASVMGATVLVERNFFDGVTVPIRTHIDGTPMDGTVADVSNGYSPATSASSNVITGTNTWKPPYAYDDSIDSADGARVVVGDCAGVHLFANVP
jgi:pectate lyase